jgi:hypothetical protein
LVEEPPVTKGHFDDRRENARAVLTSVFGN